jgi:hypothetical protein
MPLSRSTPCSSTTRRFSTRARSCPARGLLVDAEEHLAADHQLGQLFGAVSAVLTVAVISPRRMTLTVSVTSMISRSLWVMRMIVLPCAFSPFEDAEQVVGLGGGEHARGFVEDQDLGLR